MRLYLLLTPLRRSLYPAALRLHVFYQFSLFVTFFGSRLWARVLFGLELLLLVFFFCCVGRSVWYEAIKSSCRSEHQLFPECVKIHLWSQPTARLSLPSQCQCQRIHITQCVQRKQHRRKERHKNDRIHKIISPRHNMYKKALYGYAPQIGILVRDRMGNWWQRTKCIK